ncbi:uncharacterized protein LOC123452869 [Hordeum vulgare subsp. vulgare]|uniref:Uncharacterized protein n=1 Tax=Hordeum vulgare subsp. vulgare TaxID=112509 RepID=A0A8I6Y771_HORVV|nr:uncharacterized protein LOC123452869 [Hordeum vulgare subsp. vulgare]KAI4964406.1 hypothetical protein ZWY2020_005855 [Hordeum vulgare]
MAVRAGWVVAVARGSAAAWQRVACNPETLPPDRVLALICLGPLHLLTRLAACLCVPFLAASAPFRFASPRRRRRRLLLLPAPELLLAPYPPSPSSASSSSSSSSSDDDDDDYGGTEDADGIHPHVD